MFAIINTGGKQYKVRAGSVLKVEKLPASAGEEISLGSVLLLSGEGVATKIGSPFVEGAEVRATVLEQKRDDKVIVFKKRRRHNYRRKNGHRQSVTVLKVTEIKHAG